MARGSFRMGKKIMAGMFSSALLLVSLWAGPAPFALPVQYSAEVESVMGGNPSSVMQVYVDGNKSRMEMSAQGTDTIVISRSDLKVMYTLMVAQKQYMEMPMSDVQARQANPTAIAANAQWENLGDEAANGRLCHKYKITTTSATEAMPPTVSIFYFDAVNNAPVKMLVDAAGQSAVVNFRKFRAGAQDAALFEVPKDYKKFSMPGLPQGIPGL